MAITITQPTIASGVIVSCKKTNVQIGAITGSDIVMKLACSADVCLIPAAKHSHAAIPVRVANTKRNTHSDEVVPRTAWFVSIAGTKMR